jgi:hypothetical protein
MGFIAVIVAGLAAFIWGALWYTLMAKHWLAAVGLTEETINRSNPVPYVISLVSAILVAGMMRHIFMSSGVDTVMYGAISGFGLGLFVAVPWLATNYGFAQRSLSLTVIDGMYSTVGCTVIGIVLTLF